VIAVTGSSAGRHNYGVDYPEYPTSVQLKLREACTLLAFSYASFALRAFASNLAFTFCSRSALRSSFCSAKEGERVRWEDELGASVEVFGTPSVVEWLEPLDA